MNEQGIRQNMLILHNAVGELADLLAKRKTLQTKDESEKRLKELFGQNFFDLEKGLENIKRDDIYMKCGFERTGIIKLCTGQATTIPERFLNFLKKRKLIDEKQIEQFKKGELRIVLPSKNKKTKEHLDDKVKEYIKEYKKAKKSEDSDNKSVRKKVDDLNNIINSEIVERISCYLDDYNNESNLEEYEFESKSIKEKLPYEWLFEFFKAILYELKGNDVQAKFLVENLFQLGKKDFERLKTDDLKDVVEKLGNIYKMASALYICRTWK